MRPQKALAQIKAKQYANKYLVDNKPIYLIGIGFNSNTRNVNGLCLGGYKKTMLKPKFLLFSDVLKLLQVQALKRQYIEANAEIDEDLEYFNEDGISHNPPIMPSNYT